MNFASFSEELLRHHPRRSGGLIVVEQVDSTQLLGRRIVKEYAREGAVAPDTDIIAWRQAAGRGRQGRSWSSPPGCGVYATLIRSESERAGLQTLPLRTAVALCEALNRVLAGRCRLKWPNDLLVGGKKLGGILIDAVTQGEEPASATVSFGVNHRPDLAAIGESRATSVIREALSCGVGTAEVPSLSGLALDLIEAFDKEILRDVGAVEVVERYQALSSHRLGDVMRCRIDGGLLEGEFRGFDEHGFLRLQVSGEECRLSTGEILSGG